MNVEKIWLKSYQQGTPFEINPDQYSSLVNLLEEACQKNTNKISHINYNTPITYKELEQKSRQLAIYLQNLGIKKGDRIAVMMPNILQYPISMMAILRVGAIVINTNPLYTPDELDHQLNDSGAVAIIAFAHSAHTLEKVLSKTQLKHIIITEIGDVFPPLKRFFANSWAKYIKKMVPAFNLPNAHNFATILKQTTLKPLSPVSLTLDDLAFLQYTGGTTGISKGAMLTHRNMVANILQAYNWLKGLKFTEEDTIITAIPLYHIFSLTANCLTFIHAGAKNILITNPRDTKQFINTIKNSQFTAITGVNTLFNSLLNHPKFCTIDFSKTKLTLSGGMALQKSVALKWQQFTKTKILEAYGLTETSPAVTINPLYISEYTGSVGLPLPSTEISIRDDNDNELACNKTGELCVKGPQVMKGYWHKPEETALVFTNDGFLKTGDIAYIDEKGFIFLVDRKKDMIDVSGFNVYPNEVEQIISMHPGVLEVGVAGVACGEYGEKVKAWIVKRDPDLTAQQLIDYCREHLTAYKVPKIIEFCNELPKSNVGKILRRQLK